jgi:hypothetical protein
MSTLTTPTAWSAEVLAFAAQRQLAMYLDPLLQVSRRLFPTAESIEVTLESDPALVDHQRVVFDVRVPKPDVADFVQAVHRWSAEAFQLCPSPQAYTFCLILNRIAS